MTKQPHSSETIHSKKEIIIQGKQQMFQNQLHQTSYLQLFFSTIQFVDTKIWLIQIVPVLGTYFFLPTQNNYTLSEVALTMTGTLFFSLLFFINNIFKSFMNNMWELEQTFKFDLKQHISMKLLIFGSFDLIVILLLSAFATGQIQISLFHFSLFLIVPFNCFCIVLFTIFTMFRKKFKKVFLYFLGASIIFFLFKIASINDIYKQPVIYWLSACIASSLLLIFLIYTILQSYRPRGKML